MKTILLGFTLFFIMQSNQAQASWKTIVDCNRGELAIDQGDNDSLGRPTFQLIFRGEPLTYFIQQGAIDPKDVNAKGEFITWINTYDSGFMGFRPYGTASNGMHIYRNFWISRPNGDVLIRATVGNRLLGEKEKAKRQFYSCH